MKIRRKKKPVNQHPEYLMGKQETWVDKEQAENGASVRRNFWYILIFSAIILVVLIVALTTAWFTSSTPAVNTISAADTFAVSTAEQNEMKEIANDFARGMIYLAYSSDEQGALNGKNLALSCMAQNTSSYRAVENISLPTGHVDSSVLVPVVTTPTLSEGTQSYAGNYTYTFSATGAQITDDNPDGELIDTGYDFELVFRTATDVDGNGTGWVISAATITEH